MRLGAKVRAPPCARRLDLPPFRVAPIHFVPVHAFTQVSGAILGQHRHAQLSAPTRTPAASRALATGPEAHVCLTPRGCWAGPLDDARAGLVVRVDRDQKGRQGLRRPRVLQAPAVDAAQALDTADQRRGLALVGWPVAADEHVLGEWFREIRE